MMSTLPLFPVCYMTKICYSTQVLFWPHRLTVRTPAFQAVNPGSIPGGVTAKSMYEQCAN